MPDERAARLALNEARFRDINDRVARDLARVVERRDERLAFVCECARRSCDAAIELSLREYEEVRRDATRFAVAPGHEIEDVEDVLERHERYHVIQKHPEAWQLVERTHPRR